MRPFKIETLRFLYAIILHLLGLHDSFKLLKRQVTETDKLTVMCILYNIYPSPSRSPLCSISLTCSSLIFPVLFITSRNSNMETLPSPFLSKPWREMFTMNEYSKTFNSYLWMPSKETFDCARGLPSFPA